MDEDRLAQLRRLASETVASTLRSRRLVGIIKARRDPIGVHEEVNERLAAHYESLLHHYLLSLYPGVTQLGGVGVSPMSLEPDTSAMAGLTFVLQQLYADAYLGGTHHASAHVPVPAGLSDIIDAVQREGWLPTHTMETNVISGPGLEELSLEARAVAEGVAQTLRDRLESAAQEEDPHQAIKEVLHSHAQAVVIARTEAAKAQIAALTDAYEAAAVERYDWVTDSAPCPLCAAMAARSPFLVGSEVPPLHPNCRCSITPATEPK